MYPCVADFNQIPSFLSTLPSQDSSTEGLWRTLVSDVFKRSLVHFDAINRFNSVGGISSLSKGGCQDGDDAASSTCGERLFTPASEVTLNRSTTAATGDIQEPTSPKLLPTTLQVENIGVYYSLEKLLNCEMVKGIHSNFHLMSLKFFIVCNGKIDIMMYLLEYIQEEMLQK